MREDKKRARIRTDQGIAHLDRGEIIQAIIAFDDASRMDPNYFACWFNLGLANKVARNWSGMFNAFMQTRLRLPVDVSGALYSSLLWNLGIAATILGDWTRARSAWRLLGHDLSADLDTPPFVHLGVAWVVHESGDLYLGQRIDPVRVCIRDRNAPELSGFETSVVIHDAERVGTQLHNGRKLPVFPALKVTSA